MQEADSVIYSVLNRRERRKNVAHKSRIFEHKQYSYIKNAGKNQKQLFLFLILSVLVHQPAADVVEYDVEHHQQNEQGFAPAVEHKVDEEEKYVSPLARSDVVNHHCQRQISKEKY